MSVGGWGLGGARSNMGGARSKGGGVGGARSKLGGV
jgi:hypothetical protein